MDYDDEVNRFMGSLISYKNGNPELLKKVTLAKGEGIEWELS